jgi:HEPN domain-containing protein
MSVVRSWFEKAIQDLKMAKGLFALDPNFKDGSAFMCQQSIEKALKGFLIFHRIRIAKTHDLVELSEQALKIDPHLKTVTHDMERFTEYAVSYRYPDAAKAPLSVQDVEYAIVRAQEIYDELFNRVY